MTSKKIYYVICATPRSGSNLLCDLLRNTRICGKNNSDRLIYSLFKHVDWNKTDLKKFIKEIFNSSSTLNKVAGFKILSPQLDSFVFELKKSEKYRKLTINNITMYFPSNTKYIYLYRKDILKQSISYLKCVQTNIWSSKNEKKKDPKRHFFDLEKVINYKYRFKTYNWQWRKFFEINNIEPLKLEYMEVINDFRGTVIKTLKHLGIQMSLNNLIVKTDFLKQSDELNELFVKKYKEINLKKLFFNIKYFVTCQIYRIFPHKYPIGDVIPRYKK